MAEALPETSILNCTLEKIYECLSGLVLTGTLYFNLTLHQILLQDYLADCSDLIVVLPTFNLFVYSGITN